MSYWSCVQLEPCRERLALHCLSKVNGFEIYSPRIRPPGLAERTTPGHSSPATLSC
jgi:hypothetical protein